MRAAPPATVRTLRAGALRVRPPRPVRAATRPLAPPAPPGRRRRGFERRARPAGRPPRTSPAIGGIPVRRAVVMRVVVLLLFAALSLRLVGVQLFSSGRYSSMGAAEFVSTVHVPAVRGGIYDRNGSALAVSVPRSTIVADPYLIHRPAAVATVLTKLLGVPRGKLQSELSQDSGFVYLAKRVTTTLGQKVAALGLPGINVLPDTQRVDPDGSIAGPLLGSVSAAGTGQSGLEYKFNPLLAGQSGQASEQIAPDGVPLPGRTVTHTATVPGTGVELTIDEPLQYVTEQSLGTEVLASHAKSGIAIVMNTHTGDVLAMADLVAKTYPAPTPPPAPTTTTTAPPAGTPTSSTTTTAPPPPPPPVTKVVEAPQNLALTQVYEPGSVFKLVTFSAALQDGIISPSEVFTVPNALSIDGWVFHDAETHPTERLTATQILAQSSNIGTIEIAQQLGEGRLAAQIGTLGFGRPTGLGFPAESAGLVKSKPATWQVSDIGATPIGQDDAVTAQQVLDMVNTVATGGTFVPPRLVQATVAPNGTVTTTRAHAPHRALSTTVAAQLTTMMEQVVQDGTAVTAGVPGYTVAGKTGTAQIPDSVHGGYIPGAYMATFAGFAPAEHPELSAIVVLQQPSPIYGGIVAAPVFSQIMRYALHRYGIPTSPGGGTTGGSPLPIPYATLSSTPTTTSPPSTTTTAAPPTTGPSTTTTTIGASAGKPTEGP
ncbi:MAG TPA: penicillin-binding protein 2 [Acidimicrobiales bacterium]|nr:penicillin-binding protein 2 [Acidimicrobiales bacterium]